MSKDFFQGAYVTAPVSIAIGFVLGWMIYEGKGDADQSNTIPIYYIATDQISVELPVEAPDAFLVLTDLPFEHRMTINK